MTFAVPETFKGFGVDKKENWNKPKLVEYKPKQINDFDVVLENEACGLCYSDIHTLQSNWGPYRRNDLVVGHEIVGKVIAVGSKVTEFKIGQRVGIGAGNSACRDCGRCNHDNEQYCKKMAGTYNNVDPRSNDYVTQGGYSSHSIADEKFVFAIPDSIPSPVAAPLMCAGITVFSPLIRNLGKDAKGKTVGIIGIGGLGHLAVQFAHALGAKVVAFSRTSSKKDQAIKLGADEFVATAEDKEWTSKYDDEFDFILNCASGIDGLNLSDYLGVLKVDSKFISVGLPPAKEQFGVSPFTFLKNGVAFGSSLLGSKTEIIEMLRIAGEYNVKPWIEEVPIGEEACSKALERCEAGDVRYRFVFTEFDKAFN
ncbi:NADP-dependent alcohol dehydrogenase 7 [Spathaspora sp. JA1]|nr:NADP-dependent alcohol dehydrogenase 7 [Spathaspora sp. JA1]